MVISKETPLHDPAKLFRAAVQGCVVPGIRGADLADVAARLDPAAPAGAAFARWVEDPHSGLNSRFPATLFLHQRVRDAEILDRLVSFWSGDPLGVRELRFWLRAHDAATAYPLERVAARELPAQRFAFAARLIAGAGYRGWVLLVDEAELIGRYSFMPRARSYAALARWAGRLQGQACPGLLAVFAITSDFAPAVLEDRDDLQAVPGKLRASGLEPEQRLAAEAEMGMRLIARESVPLNAPDREIVQHAREQVRRLHGTAYGWRPPALESGDDLSLRMRQHVRLWINEWDLLRVDPTYRAQPVIAEVGIDLSERPELEGSPRTPAGTRSDPRRGPPRTCPQGRSEGAVPIPFQDAADLEALGAAAFLKIEPAGRVGGGESSQRAGRGEGGGEPNRLAGPTGVRGALFLINARGEPLEFAYNRVETPSTFLWRTQRSAAPRRAAPGGLAADGLRPHPAAPALSRRRGGERAVLPGPAPLAPRRPHRPRHAGPGLRGDRG